MTSNIPTREQAFQLLNEFNSNDSLIKHALAVEGTMRYAGMQEIKEKQWT